MNCLGVPSLSARDPPITSLTKIPRSRDSRLGLALCPPTILIPRPLRVPVMVISWSSAGDKKKRRHVAVQCTLSLLQPLPLFAANLTNCMRARAATMHVVYLGCPYQLPLYIFRWFPGPLPWFFKASETHWWASYTHTCIDLLPPNSTFMPDHTPTTPRKPQWVNSIPPTAFKTSK